MLIIGLTSQLPKGCSLFFWEYDGIEEFTSLEEANFLSQAFDFDVYVSESSKRNYHLVSCDIMTVEEVNSIQNTTSIEGDYLTIKETGLYRSDINRCNEVNRLWCALRLGAKGNKPSPHFVKAFLRGKRLKSLGHYRLFQSFCGFPEIPESKKHLYVNTSVQISIFNGGIGAKPKPKD